MLHRCCPWDKIALVQQVQRQLERYSCVQYPGSAQGKGIVDETRTVSWTEYRVIIVQSRDQRRPHVV